MEGYCEICGDWNEELITCPSCGTIMCKRHAHDDCCEYCYTGEEEEREMWDKDTDSDYYSHIGFDPSKL